MEVVAIERVAFYLSTWQADILNCKWIADRGVSSRRDLAFSSLWFSGKFASSMHSITEEPLEDGRDSDRDRDLLPNESADADARLR